METVGQLAAGIAHEINNPLSIIQTLIEQIEDSASEKTIDSDPLTAARRF